MEADINDDDDLRKEVAELSILIINAIPCSASPQMIFSAFCQVASEITTNQLKAMENEPKHRILAHIKNKCSSKRYQVTAEIIVEEVINGGH